MSARSPKILQSKPQTRALLQTSFSGLSPLLAVGVAGSRGGAPAGLCQARKRLHVSVSAAGGLRCVFHAWGRGLPAGRIPRNPKRNTSAKTFSKVPQTQLAGFLAPESRLRVQDSQCLVCTMKKKQLLWEPKSKVTENR